MVRVFASLRSAQSIRPPDEPGPIFRFLTIYAFFYLQDTIQFHLLRSPWRSTERLRTSKLPLCYHFSKTQQEIFPHHTAAYIKSLRFPVYRLFYSFYNIEVTLPMPNAFVVKKYLFWSSLSLTHSVSSLNLFPYFGLLSEQ